MVIYRCKDKNLLKEIEMLRENKKEFKKTNRTAYVSQLNRETHNWIHFERRVYEKDGLYYIMVNGIMFGTWEFNPSDNKIQICLD